MDCYYYSSLVNVNHWISYYVYSYHHIDYTDCIIDAETFLSGDEDKDKTISEAKVVFDRNHWEGDGRIGLIWMPPFLLSPDFEDTVGLFLWHVKQHNNGTSYIISPIKLPEQSNCLWLEEYKITRFDKEYYYDKDNRLIDIINKRNR